MVAATPRVARTGRSFCLRPINLHTCADWCIVIFRFSDNPLQIDIGWENSVALIYANGYVCTVAQIEFVVIIDKVCSDAIIDKVAFVVFATTKESATATTKRIV